MAKNKTFKIRLGSPIEGVLDMMRYDQCWPSSEADSNKLQELLRGPGPSMFSRHIFSLESFRDSHVISFTTANRSNQVPTRARWESFGCEVLED